MAAITSLVIGGVAAAGAVAGGIQSRRASKASARAAQSRAEIARLENARSRRDQIRQARIERGAVLARASTSGGGGGGFGGIHSSGTQGQIEGLRTQLSSNLSFLDSASSLNEIASQQEVKATRLSGDANLFRGISSAASSLGGLFNAI